MSKNLSFLAGRKGLDENLFEELGRASNKTGTPSSEDMELLHKSFLVGKGNILGSITFYDFLKSENRDKKVYVCNGSACLTAGTQQALQTELKQHFSPEEIGDMCCLGRCHENNAFHFGGRNYSGTSINKIASIKTEGKSFIDQYSVNHKGVQILTGPFQGLDSLKKTLNDCLSRNPDDNLAELKLSRLRGRGGAGFPISIKLETCKNAPGNEKYVVCNADEGDPGAYSDRYLLENQPYLVLIGMIITGYIIGANHGVIYIRAEYPESIIAIQNAIIELTGQNFAGNNILKSDFNFNFKLIKAQGAYICGEETALLSSIEGQRPEVRVRPPYPAQSGLFNKPTVVNNVETLANLPFIMEHGGQKFASIGSSTTSGTKLISLDGSFNKPGIYEVDMGTPLSVVIEELGKGFRKSIKALHIGGPLGGLVPVQKIKDLTVDFESFAKEGFLLGHASIVGIPKEFPIIQYIEHLFEFTAHESCGKCFPCRLGSTRGQEMLHRARTGSYKIDKTLMDDLLETLETGSLCMLGGGLPLPVKNALHYFKEELAPFFKTSVL